MIVLDASVAAKWFLPEDGTAEALELLEGVEEMIAPALIRLEVAAAITRRVRLGELAADDARQRCDRWFRHLHEDALTLLSDEELLPDAVSIALSLKHTLQDCLYLAAAQQSGIPLITADRIFHDRAAPSYPKVRLLPGCRAS